MAILAQIKDNVVVHRFALDKETTQLGRLPENDVCIDSLEVSGYHAIIHRNGDNRYFIQDLGSTNKTFVNERPIEHVQLRHGDAVRIGWVVFKFMDENNPDYRKTHKIRKSWIPGVYYTK
ncbi:MAG: FHA domain-containing protein [Gammaproteobacteria bacterium]|nr:FHA domain-containing protein [Gammaproteobacteria bacterium]